MKTPKIEDDPPKDRFYRGDRTDGWIVLACCLIALGILLIGRWMEGSC